MRWELTWKRAIIYILLGVLFGFIGHKLAHAHFADHEHWAQLTPTQRDWLTQQRVPNRPEHSCCSVADAEQVEEDIRAGHYFVRSTVTAGLWVAVPDEVIIRAPNRYGQPVVWWKYTDGVPVVRCFSPGAGL
jgi:hypothetical protein